jgi:endonuclease YncB( thermonuclease family)
MHQRLCLFILLCSFLWLPLALAADFSGRVVRVLDGDTIEVLHSNRAERFRLNGIDCQEKGQAYGKRAKQAAAELVFGKDKYRRTLADALLPDRTNVNHALVRDG